MLMTFNICKLCFMGYEAMFLEQCSELNAVVIYIYRQINMISMELLRKFNVKILNMHKIHIFTCYSLHRSALHKYPGVIGNFIKTSYGYYIGKLARG